MTGKKHYEYVDVLRGFAAITVVVYHYPYLWLVKPEALPHPPLPLEYILWPFYQHGGLAVPLFWTISGFVFVSAYRPTIEGREFFVHRFARLYPLHFVTLIVVAVLQVYSIHRLGGWTIQGNNTPSQFILQLFLASNWWAAEGHNSFNGPIWSVSVEVVVYFLFFAYLKIIPVNFVTSAFLSLLAFLSGPITHSPISACATMFFAGVALRAVPPSLLLATSLFVIEIAMAIALTHAGYSKRAGQIVAYAMPLTIVLGFIALDHTLPAPTQLTWIGKSTYSIYLVHYPILIALGIFFGVIPLWLFLVLVLGVAVPTYYFFERPAQVAIRRYFDTSRNGNSSS